LKALEACEIAVSLEIFAMIESTCEDMIDHRSYALNLREVCPQEHDFLPMDFTRAVYQEN